MELAQEQEKAIEYCTDLKRRVVAVTGQAGTGKTTIQKMAVEKLRAKGRRVVLAAPTGRAARRIYEATGLKALTIHKLLEYGKPIVDEDSGLPREGTFPSRDKENPLSYSDVFVDEYMMVNEELHRNLLDALPPGGRLLAFGDASQLPPIEPHELTGIDDVPFERLLKLPSSVQLDTVYRQLGDSGVLSNARRIRLGKAPLRTPDFTIKISEVPIKDLIEYVRSGEIDYSSMDNQIISPARRGQLGTHTLNGVLQNIYKNKMDGLELPRDKWMVKHPISVHVGEKVLCTENIYDMRDFFDRFTRWENDSTPIWNSYVPCPDSFMILNGEIGVIEDILPDGAIYIKLSDRMVQMPSQFRDYIPRYNTLYNRDPRKKLDLGYAITTHKMQGSECDNVCFIMHRVLGYMLNRNNVYTAVTRAKKAVHLITDARSLNSAVALTAAQKAKVKQAGKQDTWKVGE